MENLRFDVTHLKQLLEEQRNDAAKKYVKQYFFKYGVDVFFYDGENFVLYNRTEATNQIPDDLKLREWNAKKENMMNYL